MSVAGSCTATSGSPSPSAAGRRHGHRDARPSTRSALRAGSEIISATVDITGRDTEVICTAQATFSHSREATA